MALDVTQVGDAIAAVGALGTAAYGLVDASKLFGGGISRAGFRFIRSALKGFVPALTIVSASDPFATIRSNWYNGVDKGIQKATVKSLIRLGLNTTTLPTIIAAVPSINGVALGQAVAKIVAGTALLPSDVDVLGRFDAIIDARLDAGFERGDQVYRNSAKVAAAIVAVVLAVVGMWIVDKGAPEGPDWLTAILAGLVATPLAPIAKDLASAVSTAANAFSAVKK